MRGAIPPLPVSLHGVVRSYEVDRSSCVVLS